MEKLLVAVHELKAVCDFNTDVCYIEIEPDGRTFVQLKQDAFYKLFNSYEEQNNRLVAEKEGIVFYANKRKTTAGTVA